MSRNGDEKSLRKVSEIDCMRRGVVVVFLTVQDNLIVCGLTTPFLDLSTLQSLLSPTLIP